MKFSRTAPRPHTWRFPVCGILACFFVLVAAFLTAHAKRAATAPRQLLVATWNMCDVPQWGCQETGSSRRKVQELKRLATAGGAGVILLQETCAGDLDATREELGSGWRSAFEAYAYVDEGGRRSTVRCAERRQGEAGFGILASSSLSRVTLVPSHQPTVGLQRGILCASVAAHDVRVCNAHLSLPGSDRAHPDREFRDDQLKALVRAAAGPRTVFGGDLNGAPPSARNADSWVWPYDIYRVYRDCDQSSASSRDDRATHRSGYKLDYLFTALPRNGCELWNTGASDHMALIMRVRTG